MSFWDEFFMYGEVMNEEQLREIAIMRKAKGEQRKLNGADGGSMAALDYGAAMIAEADTFLAGLDKRLPPAWERDAADFIKQQKVQQDPDYAAYQRFKQRNPDFRE